MIVRWQEIPEVQRHAGHFRRQIELETCYVALHRYEPSGEGYDVHAHPEVQAGHVLDGTMDMVFPDGPAVVAAGESYVVPSAMPHGGRAGAVRALVLNVYVKAAAFGDGPPRPEAVHVRWEHETPRSLAARAVRRVRAGDRTLLALDELPPHVTLGEPAGPGGVPAAGAWPHDEVGCVLEGELELATDRERGRLGAGDCYHVPGGVARQAGAGPAGARLLRIHLAPGPAWIARYRDGG